MCLIPFSPESICSDCVRERCRVIRMKSRLAEDHKTISTLLKQKDPVEALYVLFFAFLSRLISFNYISTVRILKVNKWNACFFPFICSNIEECFWAGKESLRGWRKMALKQIENAEKQINTMGTESWSPTGVFSGF